MTRSVDPSTPRNGLFVVVIVVVLVTLVCDDGVGALSTNWSTMMGSSHSPNVVISLDGRSVYVNSLNNQVCKLSAETGNISWCSDPQFGDAFLIGSAGELIQGVIAVSSPANSGVATLDVQSGTLLRMIPYPPNCTWQLATTNADHSQFVVMCVVGGLMGYSSALVPLWAVSVPEGNVSTWHAPFATSGDKIFVLFLAPPYCTSKIFGVNMTTGTTIMPTIDNLSYDDQLNQVYFIEPNELLVVGEIDVAGMFAGVYDATSGLPMWNTTTKPAWSDTCITACVSARHHRAKHHPSVAFLFVQWYVTATLQAINARTSEVLWSVGFPNLTAVGGAVQLAMDSSGSVVFLVAQSQAQTSTAVWAFSALNGSAVGSVLPFPRGEEPYLIEGSLRTSTASRKGTAFLALGEIDAGLVVELTTNGS